MEKQITRVNKFISDGSELSKTIKVLSEDGFIPVTRRTYRFEFSICGPEGSCYEGNWYDIEIDADYPYDLSATFTSPILHPNVYESGGVCIEKGEFDLLAYLFSIRQLLLEPTFDDVANDYKVDWNDTDLITVINHEIAERSLFIDGKEMISKCIELVKENWEPRNDTDDDDSTPAYRYTYYSAPTFRYQNTDNDVTSDPDQPEPKSTPLGAIMVGIVIVGTLIVMSKRKS